MISQASAEAIRRLDTTSPLDRESAWAQLRPLGIAVAPLLEAAYPSFKKSQGRAALVFHSTPFARTSESAFRLGLRALQDKSSIVRYRACGLLAYSLNSEALPSLREATAHKDAKIVADAVAAMEAVSRKNHHLFVDRSHSGKTFWDVNPGDV
jgi:hypothetical protein